ncbi:MAG: LLM class flavin-dependent oxidoreductase [Halobacteriota archaeon]
MNVGLVLPTERGDTSAASDAWATVERRGRLAEDAGFDSLWVGEHHFMHHTYFDNFQTLSYLAGVTDSISLGTSVCLAPLYNPIRLAERVANLDVQNGGRTILGLGIGYRQTEFDVLGIDKSRRVPRLLETLDLFERCWSEDGVSYDGDEFAFDSVSVNPKPVQAGGPPLWLGGKAPAALRRAGRRADAWLPAPSYSVEELEECFPVYREAHEDEAATQPLWREVFVASDHDRAVDLAKDALVEKYNFYAGGHGWSGDGNESVDERFERLGEGRFLVGTPEEVVGDIEMYEERFGVDHLLVRMQWPEMDDAVAEESLELFVDEVLPAIS